MNFSVVLIARNEAGTLPRLMGSLKEYLARGGEVILVDTGSKDGTADIARSLGCRVEEVGDRFRRTISKEQADSINSFIEEGEEKIVSAGDTLFDYASARNYAAMLAKHDMVAMPDCDEIYSKLDLDVIERAIEDGAEQLEYNFVFAHDEFGGELVKFMHSKFYDRRKLQWTGIIHEVLYGDAKRKFLPESVIKLEHWQNPSTDRGGYLKGLALSVIEDPDNDRHSHYFGRELLYAGRPRSAIRELRRHVALNRWVEERSQSLVHIGDAQLSLGENQNAIHSWIDAFDMCPTRREPLMKIAEFYYRAKSPRHVLSYTKAALEIPANGFYASFQPYYEHLPHEFLYWAYWHLGAKEAGRMHYLEALRLQPTNSQYLHDWRLFNTLPKVSFIIPTLRPAGLERTLASIKALNYPKELIEIIVLRDEPRLGVPKRVKEGQDKATGEWLCYAADDMEFTPDSLMIAYLKALEDGTRFCAFSSGPLLPDEGNICEHFIIHRDLVAQIGEIFDTDFKHVGVDNLLWAKMNAVDEATRSPHARIVHHHFSKTGVMDDVYRAAWSEENVTQDRTLLSQKLKEIHHG